MSELDQYTDAQRREWSKYVATENIYIDGALAFVPGNPVPASHVDREDPPVSKSQVAGVNTKAAAAVTTPEG